MRPACFPIVASLCTAVLPSPALADSPHAELSTAALPAVHRVGVAAEHERELSVVAGMGVGFAGGVIDPEDSHQRALGSLAVSYGIQSWLAAAVRVDGRYDRHVGLPGGADDGFVGDPRLLLRAGGTLGDALRLGLQLGVWLPGAEAPSIVADAATVDAVLLATYGRPDGLRLSVNLGGRLDRSARSAEQVEMLSQPDRLALGVSESNAVLVGLGVSHKLGAAEILAEWTWDFLIGQDAPALRGSPMRLAAGARLALSDTLAAQIVLEANAAELPTAAVGEPLVPFEPRITVSAGLAYRFGGVQEPKRLIAEDAPDDKPDKLAEPEAPKLASIRVSVVTAGGAGVDGATVKLVSEQRTEELKASADGSFELGELEPGPIKIEVAATGYQPATREMVLKPGVQTELQVGLAPDLPPGQIRGVVRSYRGKPLKAKVSIQPGGISLETQDDGSFELDVAPGEYEVTIEVAGYRTQTSTVTVEENGVTIKNADLQRDNKR